MEYGRSFLFRSGSRCVERRSPLAQVPCFTPLSVKIVANRDDFRSAEFIPPESALWQHALDNSPTLFGNQPSCGLPPSRRSGALARREDGKSALLWLRLRRDVIFAVNPLPDSG
jgi:hypothetical protein